MPVPPNIPRVLLVTCRALPHGSPDDGELRAAVQAAGCRAEWACWDDEAIDWGAADLVVLRSTWDYTRRLAQFLAWAGSVRALANPSALVRWNHDKRYLGDLASASVPVVPTSFLPPDGRGELFDTLDGIELDGGSEIVIKPTVSAGSRGTGRFDLRRDRGGASAHVTALHAAGLTAMVQPFLPVDDRGETSLIYLAGRLSHAVRRAGMLPPGQVHDIAGRDPGFDVGPVTPTEPSPAQHEVARAALEAIPGSQQALYARIDLMPGPGGPVVNEVELIEPGLFLAYAPDAAGRFARAIADRAKA